MKGPAGFVTANRKVRIYGTGNNLACWIPLPVMGSAVANMLRNSDSIINRVVFISGVNGVTQNAILEALEAETREKFTVEYVDVKEIKKEVEEALERGELAKAVRV